MITDEREILILYNPKSSMDKKTVAYAQSVSKHIKTYSFHQNPFNNTKWCKILDALDMDPKELLNKANPYYQSHIRGKEFDRVGWCNVIRRNPEMIKGPIAIRYPRGAGVGVPITPEK